RASTSAAMPHAWPKTSTPHSIESPNSRAISPLKPPPTTFASSKTNTATTATSTNGFALSATTKDRSMPLPLHELAHSETPNTIVRLTENGLEILPQTLAPAKVKTTLIPERELRPGEQYRFHFNMTKCIGCRSCEVACNEQNGNPADIRWRRIG